MDALRKRRITIAKIMALNAAVAVVLGAFRLRASDLAVIGAFVASVVGGLILAASALLVNAQVESIVGVTCPGCQKKTLRRRYVRFAWIFYYECSACGVRCKRSSPLAPWRDASGPEDADKYRRKSAIGNWVGYERPEGDDSTCGKLLKSQRRRKPASVAQATVETEPLPPGLE